MAVLVTPTNTNSTLTIHDIAGLKFEDGNVFVMFKMNNNRTYTFIINNVRNYFKDVEYNNKEHHCDGNYVTEEYLTYIDTPLPKLKLAVKLVTKIQCNGPKYDYVSVALCNEEDENHTSCFTQLVQEWISNTDSDLPCYMVEDVKIINGNIIIKTKLPSGYFFIHDTLTIKDVLSDENHIGDYRNDYGYFSIHRVLMRHDMEDDVDLIVDVAEGTRPYYLDVTRVRVAFQRSNQLTAFSDWFEEERPSSESRNPIKRDIHIQCGNIVLYTTNSEGNEKSMSIGKSSHYGNVGVTTNGFTAITNDGKRLHISVDDKGNFCGLDMK